jgi:hypothetical protein
VALLAHEHAHARRAGQAVAPDVPADRVEHMEAGRREPGDVRHLRACDEADRRLRRQAEQLDEPLPRDLLDNRGGRAADVEAGVLVPGRGEPVGRERGRQRAADHEAEVAAAPHRDDSGLGAGGQVVEHLLRIERLLGQRPAERLSELLRGHVRKDGALAEALEVVGSEVGGSPQQVARVAHASSANS